MKTENISEEMIEKLYWAAVHFRDFIAMQPNASPVIWCGDRKSRVVDMPHYKSACEAVREFEMGAYGKTLDEGKIFGEDVPVEVKGDAVDSAETKDGSGKSFTPKFRLIFMGSKIPDFENSEKEDELFLKKLESMRWAVPLGGGSKV